MRLAPLILVLCTLPVSSATWPAASVHQNAVQNAINQASNGDTVTIPAGSTNWSALITANVFLTLQGAGSNSTIITITSTNPGGEDINAAIQLNGGGYNQVYDMQFKGNPATGSGAPVFAIYGPAFRISRCLFDAVLSPMHINGPFGVCDHVEFRNINANSHAYGIGNGVANWNNYYPIPFNSTNYFFFEDCMFKWDSSFSNPFGRGAGCIGSGQGGSYVVRHCTVSSIGATVEIFPFFDAHGDENDGTRGATSTQIYLNTFNADSSADIGLFSDFRGGQGLIYSNVVTYPGSTLGCRAREHFPLGTSVGGQIVFDRATNIWQWHNGQNGSPANIGLFCDENCNQVDYHNATYGGVITQPYPHPLVTSTPTMPGNLQFTSDSGSVVENQGSFTVTVIRTNGTDNAVSVQYSTSNGTALSGVNYTTTSGTLNWAAGDGANKTVIIPILDTGMTTNRTFTFSITSPTGGAMLGAPATQTITIVGSASGETFSWQSSSTSTNVSTTLQLPVVRGNGSAGTVHVDFATQNISATAGVDYTATSGTLTFPPGVTSSNVPVTITYQSATTNRTFMIILSNPVAGTSVIEPSTNTITIIGTGGTFNPGQLRIGNINVNVSETIGSITGIVRRINGVDGTASCSFSTRDGSAIAGINYVATNGTITFMDGDALNKNVAIIINNTGFVGVKTFTFYITNVSGATPVSPTVTTINIAGTGTQTISFDEPTSTASTSGVLTNWVVRENGTGGAVSVNYATRNGTALSGRDYVATNGTLNFANGVSSNAVRVNITYQSPPANRQFTIVLTNASGITITSPGTNTVTELAFTPPIQILTVHATNNSSSAFVSASVTDTNGMSSGNTPFMLYYTNQPMVVLTATNSTALTNKFHAWLLDGSVNTTNLSLVVPMSVSHIATAVYTNIPVAPPVIRTLSLASSPFTGAFISASPTDFNGAAGGLTFFTLSYTNNLQVNLFATSVPGFQFNRWTVDGFNSSTNSLMSLIMNSDHSVVALYSAVPINTAVEFNNVTIQNATILP